MNLRLTLTKSNAFWPFGFLYISTEIGKKCVMYFKNGIHDNMTGSVVTLFALLVLLFVCLASSQITFSRTWVRGKYPGEGEPENDGDSSAFLRDAKADASGRDDPMYTRVPKAPLPISINPRLLQELLRKWKSSNFNRYKEFSIPIVVE